MQRKTRKFYWLQERFEIFRNATEWLIHDYKYYKMDRSTIKGLRAALSEIKRIYAQAKNNSV